MVEPGLVKPYPQEWMDREQSFPENTVCSVIRDIYFKTDDEDVKLWCRVAVRMTKNMHKALKDYKEMLQDHGVVLGSETEWQIRTGNNSLYVKRDDDD